MSVIAIVPAPAQLSASPRSRYPRCAAATRPTTSQMRATTPAIDVPVFTVPPLPRYPALLVASAITRLWIVRNSEAGMSLSAMEPVLRPLGTVEAASVPATAAAVAGRTVEVVQDVAVHLPPAGLDDEIDRVLPVGVL